MLREREEYKHNTVRQSEQYSENSTVLCKIRLSVHCNVMNYKIQNTKRIANISTVRVWKPKYSQYESNDTKSKLHTAAAAAAILDILSFIYHYIHNNNNYHHPNFNRKH